MAPSFGRSISFPISPRPRAAACHVRSISLPCRSHPLLAHLHTQTAAARFWAANPTAPSSGLAHVDALHAALAELLLLPEPQDAVRSAASDRLLDAFLLLADAHRGFQEALLALRHDAADARAALRRRDAARLASAARSQRRSEKEIARLAAAVSSVAAAAKCARLTEETEMAAALMEAAAASAAASAAVFSAVASMSAAASSSKKTATFAAFAKKAAPVAADVAPEKLEELEQCIDECESGSEMMFRSIVRTRVSLLNIRTPAI
ncbi:uncharacterized protein LOC120668654 [Panicum virgatum]|uniref:Uncharacterized protein n=1 Tax=Panicum virgatum TaxID=38727 RepID=A0A8T0TAN3_PANVG|nr:uncharacterized protein LOC120668654 [Panicum virgatum]KAG2608591.1 hypothetical protein PVAP13_4NG335200 [Panicum virgatum]